MSDVPAAEQNSHPAARDISLHPEHAASAPVARTRRALLIGCNGPDTLPNKLRYADKDARDLAAALTDAGWEIYRTPLLNEQATSIAIFDHLADLPGLCGAQDELVIYFAGHGVRLPVPQRGTDEVFLVTHDFNPARIRAKPDSLVGLSWLRSYIEEQLPAAKVLLILDCCYAGNYATASDTYHEFFNRLKTLMGQPPERVTPRDAFRSVLAATGEDAKAFEQDGNGRLTRLLLDALAGGDDDLFDAQGNLTLDRLVPYLRQGLGAKQQLSAHRVESAEFVLRHRPDRSRAARAAQQEQARKAQRRAELQAMVVTSSEIMEDRLSEFVGRTTELREIRERIEALLPTGGYLTITAPAGQGKSSVIARLVHHAAATQPPFHFIPLDPGPDFQVPLLRNLMARLILKHQLSDLYVASDRRAVLSDEFKRLLREVHTAGKQEVIYIDGLDQFAREADGERDLSFLPEAPPPGIVFVLGTRPDDTLRPLQLRDPHQTYLLGPLSEEDFDALLRKRGITLDRADIERLYLALECNALFLTLAVRELELDRALSPDALLRRVADNPKRLFSLAIERLEKWRADWPTIRLTLGFLLTAGEPLSREVIRALVSQASRLVFDRDIRNALDSLGGLLIRDSSARYSLFHAKFRDYLGQKPAQPSADEPLFSPDEIAWFHAQAADWCAQGANDTIWQPVGPGIEQQRRAYARQHYITHLYGSGDDQRLWQVLDDGHYGRRKIADDPSTYAYALDLNLGRQSAARPELSFDEASRRLPYLWRYTLLRCSLASRADSYPDRLFSALVLLGREAEATGLAELINDRPKQVRILTTIAQLLAQHNRRDEGETLLQRAVRLARDSGNPQTLHTVMTSLLWFERFAEARSVADAIADDGMRAEALRTLAEALAVAQHPDAEPTFAEARAVADAIADDGMRAEALRTLAEALAAAQHPDAEPTLVEARAVADTIADDRMRASALRALAKALTAAQRFAEARAVTDAIADDRMHAEGLVALAEALAVAQHPDAEPTLVEARTVADAIAHDWMRADALVALAEALAVAQHPDAEPTFVEARAVADAIVDDRMRASALVALAKALTAAQRFAEARAVVDPIADDGIRAKALVALAEALTAAQRFAEARAVADAIADDGMRAKALVALAEALAVAQHPDAEPTLVEARAVADAIAVDWMRADALVALAEALTAAQRFVEARAVADAIAHDRMRAEALRTLAEALAAAQHPDAEPTFVEARAVADAIAHDWMHAEGLVALAEALAVAQHPDAEPTFVEARAVADAIAHDWMRASALVALAKALTAAQRFVEARAVADAIAVDWMRADALVALAEALAVAQYPDAEPTLVEARAVADAIAHDWMRADALVALAEALAVAQYPDAEPTLVEARAVADAIAHDWMRAQALGALAKALTAAQRFAEARAVADAIADDRRRAEALGALAEALAVAQHPDAEPTFVEARTVADAIAVDWMRADALVALAEALAVAQHPDAEPTFVEARAVADAIVDDRMRASALVALAKALTAAQRFAEARAVADAIADDWMRADALVALAEALTAAQRFVEARAVADAIADDRRRAEALGALARALTAAQRFAEARAVTDAIAHNGDRARALVALAQALATTDNVPAVLDLTQRAWLRAITRDEALRLMPIVVPLVSRSPALVLQLVDGITWVDRFLRGEDGV